ncbi:MAG: hypothetical protein R3266_07455, partial [Gemmatimonadota bacterium]|nr:hypothetical protein [Gemmatimonadota bacterium]
MPRPYWAAAALTILAVAVGWATRASTIDAREARADAELEATVLDRNIAVYEQRYGNDPHHARIGARLADGYLTRFRARADLSDLVRAEEVARDLLSTASDAAAANARLSTILLARHDFEGALATAHAAVAADSAEPAAWAVLFDAAEATGRAELAERALERLEAGHVG